MPCRVRKRQRILPPLLRWRVEGKSWSWRFWCSGCEGASGQSCRGNPVGCKYVLRTPSHDKYHCRILGAGPRTEARSGSSSATAPRCWRQRHHHLPTTDSPTSEEEAPAATVSQGEENRRCHWSQELDAPLQSIQQDGGSRCKRRHGLENITTSSSNSSARNHQHSGPISRQRRAPLAD